MGSVLSVFWNFVGHSEDQLRDGAKEIIEGDENLKDIEFAVLPTWNRAK
jgi:hypothetical protein